LKKPPKKPRQHGRLGWGLARPVASIEAKGGGGHFVPPLPPHLSLSLSVCDPGRVLDGVRERGRKAGGEGRGGGFGGEGEGGGERESRGGGHFPSMALGRGGVGMRACVFGGSRPPGGGRGEEGGGGLLLHLCVLVMSACVYVFWSSIFLVFLLPSLSPSASGTGGGAHPVSRIPNKQTMFSTGCVHVSIFISPATPPCCACPGSV